MLALAVAYGAVGSGAWRTAAWTGTAGALRLLAAAVIGASFIVVESLVLGVAELGTSRVPLILGAVTFAVVARLAVPAGGATGVAEVVDWMRLRRADAVAACAASGAAVGTLVWVWWRPFVGNDGMFQNLVQINGWMHSGRPGSRRRVLALAPVEAFPMTNDVILGWHVALTRSFAGASLWAVGGALVFALAASTVLRDRGVPALTRWSAVAAVALVPHFVAQTNSPKSDVAALAWVAVCAALAHASKRHPRLVVLAIAAGGLSIGSKSTTLPLVGLVLVVLVWEFRARTAYLAIGIAASTAVGGLWYVRNLVDHGSPLWPFTATPWGDPVAPIYAVAHSRFVSDPVATVRTQFGDWITVAAGGLLLVTVALVVAGALGSRVVRGVVLVAVGSLVVWGLSPVTGLDNEVLAGDVLTSTTRYLLPTMALGAAALALVSVDRPDRVPLVNGLFAVVIALDVAALVAEDSDAVPPMLMIGLTAVVAAVTGWLVARRSVPAGRWLAAVPVLVVVALGTGVGLAADGWTARHRESLAFGSAAVEAMLDDPGFRSGTATVAATNVIWSDLAGDEVRHDVILLPPDLDCPAYDELHRTSWLVLGEGSFVGVPDLPLRRGCLPDVEAFASGPGIVILAPASG